LNRQDAKSAKRHHERKDMQSGVFNRKRRKDVKPGVGIVDLLHIPVVFLSGTHEIRNLFVETAHSCTILEFLSS
jgi:hypothetical protein